MPELSQGTKIRRDCEVWRVNPISSQKTAPATPLCIPRVRYPYPLRDVEARHRLVDGLVHLRDCEVCECFSTLIGKIGINVIYMYRVKSTSQTSQSRKEFISQIAGPSTMFTSAGTKRRGLLVGSGAGTGLTHPDLTTYRRRLSRAEALGDDLEPPAAHYWLLGFGLLARRCTKRGGRGRHD